MSRDADRIVWVNPCCRLATSCIMFQVLFIATCLSVHCLAKLSCARPSNDVYLFASRCRFQLRPPRRRGNMRITLAQISSRVHFFSRCFVIVTQDISHVICHTTIIAGRPVQRTATRRLCCKRIQTIVTVITSATLRISLNP